MFVRMDSEMVDKQDYRVVIVSQWLSLCSRARWIHSPILWLYGVIGFVESRTLSIPSWFCRLMLSRVYFPVPTQATQPLHWLILGWAACLRAGPKPWLGFFFSCCFMPLLLLHEIRCDRVFWFSPCARSISWADLRPLTVLHVDASTGPLCGSLGPGWSEASISNSHFQPSLTNSSQWSWEWMSGTNVPFIFL